MSAKLKKLWSRWRDQKERFPSLAKWWKAGKSRIKELSINYCCAKSSDNAVKRDLLSRFASHLKERVDSGVLSLVGPYQSVLQQLAALDVEVAKGPKFVRGRAGLRRVKPAALTSFASKRSVDLTVGLPLCVMMMVKL